MVQLGLVFDGMHTALDLEEGLALLNPKPPSPRRPVKGRDVAD
jgi:rsbT antagonist protein RsbS